MVLQSIDEGQKDIGKKEKESERERETERERKKEQERKKGREREGLCGSQ
jgi:hypothetical protein